MQPDRRRWLLAGLAGLTACGWTQAGAAAGTGRPPYRVFMILFRGETPVEQGFMEYFKTRNIPVEFVIRNVDRDVKRVPALVEEARRLRVDLVYLWGTPVTVAACGKLGKIDPRRHVTDIPVVFTMVSSPEGAGLITRRSSSGRNITGVSHVVPIDQQISAIKAYRPFKRLAVTFNPAESNSVQSVGELREISRKSGFVLSEYPVPLDERKSPVAAAIPELIERIAAERPDYLYLGADSFLAANRKVVTETAMSKGLPVYSATEVMLRDGKALFGLVSPYKSVGQLAASKAILILQGKSRPQDIRVETLPSFSYIVNMTVASRINFYPSLKVVNFAEILT
jgi:putative ABC transport system substrate-binding protein